MAMSASTKDTTALSDAELAEMADLCVDRDPKFDIGFLSKQREEWVLVTTVREGNKLRGYSFCTLERIGGTPSLLLGVALVDRNAKSDQTLKCLLADQFRRALLAFPDEDVLLGLRLSRRRLPGLHGAPGRGPALRPPPDRRGARLGASAWRSGSATRRASTTAPSCSATTRTPSAASTTSPRRRWSPRGAELFRTVKREPRPAARRVRLGHGRGPREGPAAQVVAARAPGCSACSALRAGSRRRACSSARRGAG